MQIAFNDFPLDHRILKSLQTKGFVTATEIQSQAIPHGLLGKDLLASSKTGSGKTLAFLLPALHRVLKQKALSRKDPRVLILAPTRELAKQVYLQLKGFISGQNVSACLILGGENYNDQVKTLRRYPQFVVGTPGRIADHVKDKSLFLNGLELLIMDEADRMLDLGFSKELDLIHSLADHRKRQTMMFSATMDSAALHSVTQKMLRAPHRISIGSAADQHKDIQQQFYLADDLGHKERLLEYLLQQQQARSQVIVFVATREDTERLAALLNGKGFDCVALSANLTQPQRSNIMNDFTRGQAQVLVTTDVASRGLDLLKVGLVINFDLPKLADEYVHRIGRTGRAGNQGEAVSLVGAKDWSSYKSIKVFLNQNIEFSVIRGLEAKFKGIADKPQKKLDGPHRVATGTQKKRPARAPQRVKTQQGVDVGHIPMKKK